MTSILRFQFYQQSSLAMTCPAADWLHSFPRRWPSLKLRLLHCCHRASSSNYWPLTTPAHGNQLWLALRPVLLSPCNLYFFWTLNEIHDTFFRLIILIAHRENSVGCDFSLVSDTTLFRIFPRDFPDRTAYCDSFVDVIRIFPSESS